MSQWRPPIVVTDIGTAATDASLTPDDPLRSLLDRGELTQQQVPPEHAWLLTRRTTRASDTPALTLIRPDGVSLTIDFSSGKARHRARESGKGIQPLARALGIAAYRRQHGEPPAVIDATGGLGQDAWALATLEVRLTVIERHPLIHVLLADALARARAEPSCRPIESRITLIHAAAETRLASLQAHAIYLDPMYPERTRKKAESRKGMQFLHALLGPPEQLQGERLLPAALDSKVSRVVVKRPRGAELLAGSDQWQGQRTSQESPNTRFDIYHVHTG